MKFKNYIEVQSGIIDSANSSGTLDQVLTSTETGVAWVEPSTISAEAATLVVIECKNTSGATITKGTPVYQTGTVGATDVIEIAPADALISSGSQPAIGLLQTTLNNNGFGKVVITGEFLNFTTDPIDGLTPTTGDKIFLKSGGGLTLTKPTGAENGIQNLGLIGKVSSGNAGSITVSSIMRTNDVPNLPTGKIWVGDSNTIVSDTVFLDEPNGRMGIGTTSPNAKLDVDGAGNFSGGTVVSGIDTSTDVGVAISKGDYLYSNDGNYLRRLIGQQSGGSIDIGQQGTGLISNINFFPGTSGNIDFFGSGSIDMRVASTGNVGIGTTSPSAKLHIQENSDPTSSVSGLKLSSNASGTNKYLPAIEWSYGASGTPSFAKIETIRGLGTGGILTFSTATTSSVMTETMRITSDGNVGIGTTSPTNLLSLRKDLAGGDVAIYLQNYNSVVGSTDETVSIKFAHGNDGGSGYVGAKIVGGKEGDFESSAANVKGFMSFYTNEGSLTSQVEQMRINGDGNVGIGTTSPGAKLDVVGSGLATLFRVSNTTADATTKYGTFTGRHYTNSEENITGMLLTSSSSVTGGTVSIGGGISAANAVNNIILYTAANNTTLVGTERMRINSSGNVGIGTTSPGVNFQVGDGTTDTSSRFYHSDNTYTQVSGYGLYFSRLSSYIRPVFDGTQDLYFGNINRTWKSIQFDATTITFDNNSSEAMRITSSGNVGIGTTSPSRLLSISNNDATTTPQLLITQNGTGDAVIGFNRPGYQGWAMGIDSSIGNNFEIHNSSGGVDSSSQLAITPSGNVGIGTTSPSAALDVKDIPSGGSGTILNVGLDAINPVRAKIHTETYNGAFSLYDSGSSEDVKITTSGNSWFNGGNVGIGTTSPSTDLQVIGTVRADVFGVQDDSTNPSGNTSTRVTSPAGATYDDQSNSASTGVLSVILPTVAASTMLSFTIRVFDYANNESFDVNVAGYWYGSNLWTNTSVRIESQGNVERNFNVRFGKNNTTNKGWVGIGETTTNWSYVKFAVLNFQAAHVNDDLERWNDLWDTAVLTSLTGYTTLVTKNNNQVNNWARNGENLYYGSGSGNVGIGTTGPQSKLQVVGGIQMADDTDTASAAKVGTLKYRVSGNNSYVDMCMQTGATTYAWINIVQNNW